MFFELVGKTRWPPWPLIGWDIFRVLFWNRWTKFDETWQEERSQRPLPSLRSSGRSEKNKMAVLASDLLRHFRLLLWNRLREFNENWQEARSQHPLPSLCFAGRSGNKMAALTSYWLRHFRLLCNCWIEFNETWLEASTQHSLASLSFYGKSLSECVPFQKEVLRCTIVALGPLFCIYWCNSMIFVIVRALGSSLRKIVSNAVVILGNT